MTRKACSDGLHHFFDFPFEQGSSLGRQACCESPLRTWCPFTFLIQQSLPRKRPCPPDVPCRRTLESFHCPSLPSLNFEECSATPRFGNLDDAAPSCQLQSVFNLSWPDQALLLDLSPGLFLSTAEAPYSTPLSRLQTGQSLNFEVTLRCGSFWLRSRFLNGVV